MILREQQIVCSNVVITCEKMAKAYRAPYKVTCVTAVSVTSTIFQTRKAAEKEVLRLLYLYTNYSTTEVLKGQLKSIMNKSKSGGTLSIRKGA